MYAKGSARVPPRTTPAGRTTSTVPVTYTFLLIVCLCVFLVSLTQAWAVSIRKFPTIPLIVATLMGFSIAVLLDLAEYMT